VPRCRIEAASGKLIAGEHQLFKGRPMKPGVAGEGGVKVWPG